ncbi:MAG: hypothetical protein H6820_05470 [Phycisphaerales bacterium]|nr:hypothetical protein [Phycisphaerales bacterium]
MDAVDYDTPLPGTNGATIGAYWKWAFSDIVSNANRGVFAEFLVAHALGVADRVRIEWDAVDLRYAGVAIEVKSAAYVQSWAQKKLSAISYDIELKTSWDSMTNTSDSERRRSADIYVFCLFNETHRELARQSVLDMAHWEFFIVETAILNAEYPVQKSVQLSRIQRLTTSVAFSAVKARIDEIIRQSRDGAVQAPQV